ncbi:MAG: succinate dehydrogenase/fumarate reductase iron-sulfur subunit [Gemmatimonadota bacterium]|jgi:succinate dehydrogenase / fumarate reductase iron-sulfur subunit|nr:succinate dehydrogenase/fumarate reductase iron-sulfur subunit [Gemmatimonadota bacterium]
MRFTLRVHRQTGPEAPGALVQYSVDDISPDTSFLEMMDLLNEQLTAKGEDPIAFDSDCREGICGMCSMVINAQAHGPLPESATCQVYMRQFQDGDVITVEPFRAAAFPLVRDLIVDRSAFDRIMQAGGFISVHSGPKPDPNSVPIEPGTVELALDAASCIGCGACVAACPNASAMLYTAAKVSHLGLLPQGQPERYERVRNMVGQMEDEGFGACRNYGECEAQCPKGISIGFIGRMNHDYLRASLLDPVDRQGKMVPQ